MIPLTFDTAFDRLIGVEGGYVNDPNDSGGETNWGISKASYPNVDIKNLTRDGAKKIYKADFWDQIEANNIPPSIAFQAFDFAVNSGISTAIRKLQSAVGVADDGQWGPVSKAALASYTEGEVIMNFVAQRLLFWTVLTGWSNFGRGWARRAAKNLQYASSDT